MIINKIISFTKSCGYCLYIFSLVMVVGIAGFQNNNSVVSTGAGKGDTTLWPRSFGFGRRATAPEIAAIDIAITPGGRGLPPGSGNVSAGKSIYEIKCAFCHGKNGTEGPFSPLVGAMGDTTKARTIGNYWPYATTLFDYIRRAMPFNAPGSLSNNEVYGVTAYLLYKNKITDATTIINAANLPKVTMPAQKLFVNDDRHGGPEVR